MEVLQKLYPDKKQRTDRIQEILGKYDALRDDNRKKRPNADESSHENFAINQTAYRLSDAERQAMEKTITGIETQLHELKEFAAKEKLEIVQTVRELSF